MTNTERPTAVLGLTRSEMAGWFKSLGEPAYRADQLFTWLFQQRAETFESMTNLPAELRGRLAGEAVIDVAEQSLRQVDPADGTRKYLLRMLDGETVEAVLMRYRHGYSLCVSTQVGCRMGCRFCASTIGGKARDLSAAEIVNQVVVAQRDLDAAGGGRRVGGIVVMGIGEPLENYDETLRFLRVVHDPKGLNIGYRHITVSTVGLAPAIRRLAGEGIPITLAVSLHAPNDYVRTKIMPVNAVHPLAELIDACRAYIDATGRRISFEYIMINGVNDHPELARELLTLLDGLLCHVNLIPMNPVAERPYEPSTPDRIRTFQNILHRGGISVTVRRTLGRDIEAACGQLRRRESAQKV